MVNEKTPGVIRINGNAREYLEICVITPEVLMANIEETCVSPSYGIKEKSFSFSWEWYEQSRFMIGLYDYDTDKFDVSRPDMALKNFNSLSTSIHN